MCHRPGGGGEVQRTRREIRLTMRADVPAEPEFIRQGQVLALLGVSEETLRAMRACDPELAVDLTGRGRLWYRRERVLAKLGNAKFKSAELKRAETGAGPPNPGGKAT